MAFNLADMYSAFDQIREMGAEPGPRVLQGTTRWSPSGSAAGRAPLTSSCFPWLLSAGPRSVS